MSELYNTYVCMKIYLYDDLYNTDKILCKGHSRNQSLERVIRTSS